MSETLTPIASIGADERPLALHGVQPGLRPRLFAHVDEHGDLALDWPAIETGAHEGNFMARMLLAARKDGSRSCRAHVRATCSVLTRAMVGLQVGAMEVALSMFGNRSLPDALAALSRETRKARDAGAALLAEEEGRG